MQDKKFRFYIRLANGASWDWFKVSSGSTSFDTSSTPVNPLEYAPKGWQEIQLSFERRAPKWGIFRSYSTPLTFVADTATIMRYLYHTYGVECKAQLYIQWYNSEIATDDYELMLFGDLDFSTYSAEYDSINCTILEGGFVSQYDSRETTEYTIDVRDNADVIWIHLHECHLLFRQTWSTVYDEVVVNYPIHSPLITEGVNLYTLIYQQDEFGSTVEMITNNDSVDHDYQLKYTFNYNLFIPSGTTTGAPYKFELVYLEIDPSNTIVNTTQIYISPGTLNSGASATYVGSNTQTVNIQAGNKLILKARVPTTTGSPGFVNAASRTITQKGSTLELKHDTVTPEKYFPALRAKNVWEELVDKISDGATTADSSLLDTYIDYALFSGDSLRNLPKSKIKTSANDFIHSINSLFSCGVTYERSTDTVSLVSKSDLFEDTELLDLGEVSDVKVVPFTSEMFSKLQSGYEDVVYDEVNGKDEPNTLYEWTTPNTRIKGEMNLVSRYHAARTGILKVSLNLDGKVSIDSDYDNQVYIANITSSVSGTVPTGVDGAGEDYYDLYIDPSLTITNVYDPTALFNVNISNRRNLQRNEPFLHSLLDKLDAQYLKLETVRKSNDTGLQMVTDDGVTEIDEGANILIGDMAGQLFQPTLIEFKVLFPNDMFKTVEANRYRYVSFTINSEPFKGFIMDFKQQPFLNNPQTMQVLAHPTTDLSKLIY